MRGVGLLLLAWLAVALAGCGLVKLRQESQAFYSSTVLAGQVRCTASCAGPLVVAAFRADRLMPALQHAATLHEAGGYELIVPAGRYRVFAFADANGNGRFDAGEPAGEYESAQAVEASGTGVVALLDIVLQPGHASALPVAGLRVGPHSTQAGAIARLDEAAFSARNGERGYWEPMAFFQETGGNIYFLEPYDPQRIPVLFVHGAVGSAQDWRTFFDQLDRRRYQAWFFMYPSGASVESMAYLLYWKLLNLQLRHRFDTLYLAAHSMGGLVVRTLLLDHATELPQARLFVSLSTPWGGEAGAEAGVKHSPAVVPSWVDMQPGGDFMARLFARPLPPQVAYYLFFGHKGGYSLLRPNNDGTVTLASQLRQAAQAEARMVVGFEEDHDSILRAKQVVSQFHAVLGTQDRALAAGSQAGRVRVAFSFADGFAGTTPTLLLRPVNQPTGAPFVMPLGMADDGRLLGPVPPGEYDAALVASAFAAEPAQTRLRVGSASGETPPTVRARFMPQGTLNGYVAADAAPGPTPAGMYRPPHPALRIEAITLKGPGVLRVLRPDREGGDDLLQHYVARQDGLQGPTFAFVDLPAGEYELTIEAVGYRPYTARHAVVPGRTAPLAPITLVKAP